MKRDCTRSLKLLGACEEAVTFAKGKILQEAWNQCPRADWMLWLMAQRCSQDEATHRKIVLVSCAIARTTLHLGPKNDPRPEAALRVAERWGRGEEVSPEERQAAGGAEASAEASAEAAGAAGASAWAARASAWAARASAWAARASAWAARASAGAAEASAWAARASAWAAEASAWAAGDSAWAAEAAWAARASHADIVRHYFPHPPVLKLRKG